MPRNPDPFAELFDRIRETVADFAHDALDDALGDAVRIKAAQPHKPPRRVNGRIPKQAKRRNPAWTHYDTLQVSPHADAETIRAAWISLCKRYHPDTGKQKSAERMKRINAAWEILGDEKKRTAYDREIGLKQ